MEKLRLLWAKCHILHGRKRQSSFECKPNPGIPPINQKNLKNHKSPRPTCHWQKSMPSAGPCRLCSSRLDYKDWIHFPTCYNVSLCTCETGFRLTFKLLHVAQQEHVRMFHLQVKFNSLKQNSFQYHHFLLQKKRRKSKMNESPSCNHDSCLLLLVHSQLNMKISKLTAP